MATLRALNPAAEAQKQWDLFYGAQKRSTDDYARAQLAERNRAVGEGYNAVKQQMADQGMLSSTAAGTQMQRAYQQIADPYTRNIDSAQRQLSDLGKQRGDYIRQFYTEGTRNARNEARLDRDAAMKAWESLLSYGLGKGSLSGNLADVTRPRDPAFFASLWRTNFLAPGSGTGPTGDAKWPEDRVWKSGRTMQGQQLDQNASQFAQQMAQADDQMDWEKQKWADTLAESKADRDAQDKATSPENLRRLAFQDIAKNRQSQYILDETTGQRIANPAYMTPDDMADYIQGAYGIDPRTDPVMMRLLGLDTVAANGLPRLPQTISDISKAPGPRTNAQALGGGLWEAATGSGRNDWGPFGVLNKAISGIGGWLGAPARR